MKKIKRLFTYFVCFVILINYTFTEENGGMPGIVHSPESVKNESVETKAVIVENNVKEDNPELTKLFLLKYTSLYDMEKVVYDKFKPKELVADKKKNGMLITDAKDKLDKIDLFLKEYDKLYTDALTEEEANNSNLRTKVFKVNFIEIDRAREHLQTHLRNSSVSRDELRGLLIVTGTSNLLLRAEEILKAIDTPEMNIKTEHIPVYFRDAQLVSNIIKTNFTSKVLEVDKDRNSVIVSDTQEKINKIKEFLKNFDFKPPTILIEGTIIKVDQNKMKEYGTKIEQNYKRTSKIPLPEKGENTENSITSGTDKLNSFTDFAYTFETPGGMYLNVRVGALVAEGIAEILLKPHINFLSGKKGSFEQNTVTHREVEGKDGNIGYETKTGLSLVVGGYAVPYDGKYKIILSDLKLKDGDQMDSQGTRDRELIFDAPQIVDDGQLIILGGAISKTQTVDEAKMPILGDIPLLGELFKTKSKTVVVSETLALLRLKVIDSNPLNYAFKSAQFETIKELLPMEFGGNTNDSIEEHPLKTAEWSSKIIYNGGGYFEKIYGKYSEEIQEKAYSEFRKKIRARIKLVTNWSDKGLIKKMIFGDTELKEQFINSAASLNITPLELLIMARHKGGVDDELYLAYLEKIRSLNIENFKSTREAKQ